jgi:cobaltochelatase CobT
VDAAVKAGVDIMGVGILDDSVERYYPKHVVINNINDLAGAAMDQIARALLGERFVVDNSKLLGVA